MPKAWKILFLKPGLLGLASCWCWLLPVANCPSCSALCTSELFACIRLCSHAYVSGRRWDSIRIRSGCAGRDERRGGTKKRTKRKKKRIVDDYKCSCQLLHSMRMCVLLICTLRWRTEERKKERRLTSSWLCSCSLLAKLDREPRLVELFSSPSSCATRALFTSSNAYKEIRINDCYKLYNTVIIIKYILLQFKK